VLLDLLPNAIKYNRPGGCVTITVEDQTGERVRIAITDTGRGLPAEHLSRLFVPFERLDAARTDVEGTGLGLSVSRDLVQSMGGTLGVSSIVDVGSTFWVELAAVEPVAVTASPLELDDVVGARSYAAPKQILCVEDMVTNVKLVEQILKRPRGVTIMPAMLGGIAVDLARQNRPDLILLDMQLPDIDGREVLRRLRSDPHTATIPVIIVSADATRHNDSDLLAMGARRYLTKPIDLRALLEAVDDALEPGP
jgi:CheY-like chemotaxis protein